MSIYNYFSGILKDGGRKFKDGVSLYFLGALGAGMLPLSELSSKLGARIFGSDRAHPGEGKYKHITFLPLEKCKGIDLVVFSLAISEDDPELRLAKALGIKTVSRPEFLGLIMGGYSHRIGVAGTHGKSTTTALLHTVLSLTGKCPTTISGADLPKGGALSIGARDYLVFEACEYRDAFLSMHPSGAVITNIELDHTDYFKDEEQLYTSFLNFAVGCSEHVLIGTGTDMSRRLLGELPHAFSFGKDAVRGFGYTITEMNARGSRFILSLNGEGLSDFEIAALGEHNVANTAAALAISYLYGADITRARQGLSDFCGIARRAELLGYIGERAVYYDYAHHPTEIRATLTSLKIRHGALTVIFRPHTYTRTRSLFGEFASALSLADNTVVLDVYAARKEYVGDTGARELAGATVGGVYLKFEDAVNYCLQNTSGAIILMGAGEVDNIKNELVERIKQNGG